MTTDLEEGLCGMGSADDMVTNAIEAVPGREAEAAELLGDRVTAPAIEFECLSGVERVNEVRPRAARAGALRGQWHGGRPQGLPPRTRLGRLAGPKLRIEEVSPPEAAETLHALCGDGGVTTFSAGTVIQTIGVVLMAQGS